MPLEWRYPDRGDRRAVIACTARCGTVALVAGLGMAVLGNKTAVGMTAGANNGVAILIPTDNAGYVAELRKAIQASARFTLVSATGLGVKLKMPQLIPDPPLSVAQRNAIAAKSPARWLLIGAVTTLASPSTIVVSARALDLELGDLTATMRATSGSPGNLAQQTLKFLRLHYPLRGRVAAIREDAVFLDVGLRDGVAVGSVFFLRRQTTTRGERVATVAVTEALDWYSLSEVQEKVPGRLPQTGDIAIEDTSAFLESR